MQQTLIKPVSGPTVWRAADYADTDESIHRLSAEALTDIDHAMREVARKGLTLDDLTPAAFDLPALADDLREIKHILGYGRGFVLIKGIDIAKYSEAELGIITYGLGTHIGTVVSQSHLGDRLGHVIDRGEETNRYYTRGGSIEFHMDPVDVVGLFCLRPAISGGESWVCSSMAVHNAILEEHPEYLAPLYRGYHYCLSRLQGGGEEPLTDHPLPIFASAGDQMTCFYLPTPMREAEARGYRQWTRLESDALNAIEAYANRPDLRFKMDFEPGDIQFLNNRTVLHARTDYVDHDDPRQKRHLFRVWMMVPDWAPRPDSMQMRKEVDRGGGGIPLRPSWSNPTTSIHTRRPRRRAAGQEVEVSSDNMNPIVGKHVWRGPDLAARDDWIHPFPQGVIDDLDKVVRAAVARGETEDSFQFDKTDIPALRDYVAPVKEALGQGYGFAVLRGVPVERYTVEELKMLLLAVGHHIGLIGKQGDRARGIGEVMDTSTPEKREYYYHVGGSLPSTSIRSTWPGCFAYARRSRAARAG